ncbi:copper resistance protein NlpE [Tabrizicola flagellatus]|uniref:copper resistance protein NlpE n=1 Tax=Tabrizicola flagellatus TaxID=2593021 RepID=UPI0011F2C547|nr:copper resistance protein NlpE [Tabrizicola flagellatus]
MRAALAALVLLASPLSAETRQHGNVILDLPQGWSPGGTLDGGTLVLTSGLPEDSCPACRIYVTPGERAGGRVDDWIAGQVRRFLYRDEDPAGIERLSGPSLVNLKGRPAAVMGQKIDGRLQVLFAVQLFGRMELIGFEAAAADADRAAAAMRVFERDVVPMMERARFVSEGAAPLLPAPQPGALEGVWWGTSTWWSVGLDAMLKMEIDHHWLTFWRDGTFYRGTPPLGTAPFDPPERLAVGDMDWGSYRLDGDRLTLSYASGETETYSVADGRLTLGDRVLDRVELLADGTRIDGTVSTLFATGFTPGIGMSGGGMTAMTDTRYRRDGTWTYGSYAGASASFDNGSGFATGSERSEEGRYEVRNGLILLYGKDGRVLASDYIFKAGGTIWIGSETLE